MIHPRRPKERSVQDITQTRYLVEDPMIMPRLVGLMENIQVGSCYEIDRSKLPPRTPATLRQFVRFVMVTAKTELNVTVRYPNTEALVAYFDNPDSSDQLSLFPLMDEKYVMGPVLAVEVLVRRIPSTEFKENRYRKAFWLEGHENTESKMGSCFFELQANGYKGWGVRRMVAYVSDDAEDDFQHSSPSTLVEEEEEEKPKAITVCRKRKHKNASKKRVKTPKRETAQKALRTTCKQNVTYIDRWPVERYERAKLELLTVMKAKGAFYGSAISRSDLRAETRKRIGDTGLLDHLLKHVAGQLAPGGVERFRRRFDSEGTMEYWLESADLVDIRKEAGVNDPYWTPPPGWQPGDSTCAHNSDCATEIRLLKEELAKMKRSMQNAASIMQDDDTRAIIVVPEELYEEPIQMLDIASSELKALKDMHEDLLKKKAHAEEQLLEISQSLREVEVQMIARAQQV